MERRQKQIKKFSITIAIILGILALITYFIVFLAAYLLK